MKGEVGRRGPQPAEPGRPRKKTLQVVVSDEMKAAIVEAARRNEQSVSTWILGAIKTRLGRSKRKPA